MAINYTSHANIEINVTPAKVWDALTNPEMIKQYLFGTEAESDWKEGSAITYKGVWDGKAYEDKGKILKSIPGQILISTYWSSMSGKPDVPVNYQKVTYELIPTQAGTRLTITQDNNETEESRDHSKKNWESVLTNLKNLLEK